MATLSDLLFKIMMPFLGILVGMIVGESWLGMFGIFAGAVMGFFLFAYLGEVFDRVYLMFVARYMHRELAPLSVEELRSKLGTSFTPNFILLELKLRGEDISRDVAPVLSLLEANEPFRRIRGWAALLSLFPNFAASIRGYNPTHPLSVCQEKVAAFRRQLEMSTPPPFHA